MSVGSGDGADEDEEEEDEEDEDIDEGTVSKGISVPFLGLNVLSLCRALM